MRNKLEQALDTLTNNTNNGTMFDRFLVYSKKYPDLDLTYTRYGKIIKIKNGKVL